MSPRVQKNLPFREAPQWSIPISELRLTIERTALVSALAMTYVHGGDYAGGDHAP